MKLNKNTIITAAAIIGAIFFISITFKIYFSIRISEKEIKSFVTEFVKKSFNKSIIFNDSYVDFTGDVILIEPNISFEEDFNDNQSLIKASKAVIKLRFPDILFGNYNPKKIIFYSGDITIINRNQNEFPQKLNIKKILSENLPGFNNNITAGIRIQIKDSKLNYIDILKDKKHSMKFFNTSFDLEIQKDNLLFVINTKISPYKTKDLKHGYIKAKGSIPFSSDSHYNANLNIENFDISILNDYLEYSGYKSVSITGSVSAELKVSVDMNNVIYNGLIETANLNLFSSVEQHKFISNENLNIAFKISDNQKDFRIETDLLKIFDDNIQLNFQVKYIYKPKEESITFSAKSNKINLGSLSSNYSPAPGIIYSGESNLDMKFSYNLSKEMLQELFIDNKLTKLSVSKLEKDGVKKIISELNCFINADNKKFDLNSTGFIRDSKARLDIKSKIKNLDPFKSDSDIFIKVDKLYSSQVFYLTRAAVETLFNLAQDDIKRGYEEIFFLQKTAGKIINNNNFNLDISSNKIQLFEGYPDKYFSNLNLKIILNNGILTTNSFNLSGFGSNYEFALSANMNTDQPFFKFKTAVKDFDLSALSEVSGKKADISGKLNVSFEYEVSAFRFSNILENSKGDLTASISDCSMKNTDIQNNLSKFFTSSGFSSFDLNSAEFKTVNITIGHAGENFFIKNFTIGGGNFSVNGFGKYSINDGINLPLSINIADGVKTTNAPILIKGRLFNPDLEISNQKNSKDFRLFNID